MLVADGKYLYVEYSCAFTFMQHVAILMTRESGITGMYYAKWGSSNIAFQNITLTCGGFKLLPVVDVTRPTPSLIGAEELVVEVPSAEQEFVVVFIVEVSDVTLRHSTAP